MVYRIRCGIFASCLETPIKNCIWKKKILDNCSYFFQWLFPGQSKGQRNFLVAKIKLSTILSIKANSKGKKNFPRIRWTSPILIRNSIAWWRCNSLKIQIKSNSLQCHRFFRCHSNFRAKFPVNADNSLESLRSPFFNTFWFLRIISSTYWSCRSKLLRFKAFRWFECVVIRF